MKIQYSVSLWNFSHYAPYPTLERIVQRVREEGFGIELWQWSPNEADLYDETGRKRLAGLLEGMAVSLHSGCLGGRFGLDYHRKQIDAAVCFGAKTIIMHDSDLTKDNGEFDVDMVNRAIQYAASKGVTLCLENGYAFDSLAKGLDAFPELSFCLDVGHVYMAKSTMKIHLDAYKHRLAHMHLQDIRLPSEDAMPLAPSDHYTPGSGGIPHEDWQLLGSTLREIDFNGIATIEVLPRNPLQLAKDAVSFWEPFTKD